MKKYSGSIVAVVGALFFLPGLVGLLQGAGSLSVPLVLLVFFYLVAIILGLVGALAAINKPAAASKILAVGTLSGILLTLFTLYLSTSLEGLYFRYTIMGLFFLAVSTALVSKQKE